MTRGVRLKRPAFLKGVAELENGEAVSLGSFAKYVDDDDLDDQ